MVQQVITFNTGKTTCASEPGKFCRFLGATHFGTRPVCMLFDESALLDVGGWVQRCEQCMSEFPNPAEKEQVPEPVEKKSVKWVPRII